MHTSKSVVKIISTNVKGDDKQFDELFKTVGKAMGDAFGDIDESASERSLEADGVKITLKDGVIRVTGEVKAIIVNDQEFHAKK
jgi:hypothetical protein